MYIHGILCLFIDIVYTITFNGLCLKPQSQYQCSNNILLLLSAQMSLDLVIACYLFVFLGEKFVIKLLRFYIFFILSFVND